MQEKVVNSLYDIIVENSWKNGIDNYMDLLSVEGSKLVKDEASLYKLIDKTLKKILLNLMNNVDINKYDQIIFNMGDYQNQDGFDFGIGLIKSFYRDQFIINDTEYTVLDMMNTIVEQYKTKDTLPVPKIFHYILATLFRVHYALYIKGQC